MNRHVTMEELAADVAAHIEAVRNGDVVTVVDGTSVVATITPPASPDLRIIRHDPSLRLQDFDPGPPLQLDVDPVQWLVEERERERSGGKQR
jgi:antitoxin (DNA-binding transcriptional repressor) of toxin-antitoxin stability system